MRTPRAVLVLLALAALAAGCLHAGPDAEAGPRQSTTPVPTPTPTPTPTPGATPPPEELPEPPSQGTPVPFRTLATGQTSAMPYPLRLVFTDAEEWRNFWNDHHEKTQDASGQPQAPPPAPEVDFAQERVVAVTLGDQADGCTAVRVTNVTAEGGTTTTVHVTTYRPGPGQLCTGDPVQPYAMVAIPDDGTEVAYREVEMIGVRED